MAWHLRLLYSFMIAAKPWPFNLNFFFLPKRVRLLMEKEGVSTDTCSDDPLPESIAAALSTVAIDLKTAMMKVRGGESAGRYAP